MGRPSNPPCGDDYVLSAYPESITYGANEVIFNRNYDDVQTGCYPDGAELRSDTPRDICSDPNHYSPPEVMETHRLDSIEVKAGGQRVRSYDFDYDTTAYQTHCYPDGCKVTFAGQHTLSSLKIRGRTQGNLLQTLSFGYYGHNDGDGEGDYDGDGDYNDDALSFSGPGGARTWPHLEYGTNGFGGEDRYVYQEQSSGCLFRHPWSHEVVRSRTQSFGAGQPDVVTNYDYSDGPYEVPVDRYDTGGDYRGFGQVTETDAAGNRTVHYYYTTNYNCSGGGLEGVGGDDILTGLEKRTEVWASGGSTPLLTTENTWDIRPMPMAGLCSVRAQDPYQCSNFVYLSQTVQTLDDGTKLRTRYAYDDWGNQTTVYQDGKLNLDGTDDPTDNSVIDRPYVSNSTGDAWISLPKLEQVKKPADGTILAETSYFYDGAASPEATPTAGNLTALQKRIDQADATKTTNSYRVYDGNGNLLKESVPTTVAPSDNGGSGTIPSGVPFSVLHYDATNTYVDAETNPVGQTTTYDIDPVIGKPTEIFNPDGSQISLVYDQFGRLTTKRDSVDSGGDPTTTYDYNWSNPAAPQWTNVIHKTGDGSPNLWETHCYDGFGRQVQVRTPLTGGSQSVVDTHYNARGLKEWVSNPYEESGTACSNGSSTQRTTYSSYDALGRVTQVTNPDGTSVSTQYHGLTTTTIDENGHKKASLADAFGRTAKVEEYTNDPQVPYATTLYSYDLLGDLTQVQDAAGHLTTMTYDMLGRKTGMTDPDAGSWQYTYDEAGNLTTEVGPDSAQSGRTYDALNRVETRWYGDGTPATEFTYDAYPDGVCSGDTAVGRLTKMVDQSGVTYWCYDTRGRVTLQRKVVDGVPYDVHTTYDSADRVDTLAYPDPTDPEVVTYHYDGINGQLTRVDSTLGGSYLAGAAYNAALKPASATLGNNLTTTYGYDDRLRVGSIVTPGAQNLGFTYDNVGNVWTITDEGQQTTFGYDELNRLTSASGGGDNATYAYDQIGNMTHKQEGSQDLDLLYQDPAHVHAATLARDHNTGVPVVSPTYSSRGNLMAEGANTYEYDMDNRLVSIHASNDADGDGCTAAEEAYGAPWPNPGSSCSSLTACYSDSHWYDFYDVPRPVRPDPAPNGTRDRAVSLLDVLAVLKYVPSPPPGGTLNTPNVNGLAYNADKGVDTNGDTVADIPPDGVPDGRAYDRSISPAPNPPWDAGPPDGAISLAGDVMPALKQVGLFCQDPLSEKRLVAQYTYDGQGNLVKRTMGDGSSTVYIGGLYEKHSDGTYVKYYSALGRRIAMRDSAGVHYILADHLGSSTVVTSSSGAVEGTMKYYPYGAQRSATDTMVDDLTRPTDKLFTGQQKESDATSVLGLYNYGARFYSTLTGRFISPDPLVAAPGDPQMLNRYAYARDNPLIYIDPTGLDMIIVCGLGQNCQGQGDWQTIEQYRELVMTYWMVSEGVPADVVGLKWDLFLAYIAYGATPEQQLAAGGVAFLSTSENIPSGAKNLVASDFGGYVEKLRGYVQGDPDIDTLVGFSLGGYVVAKFLSNIVMHKIFGQDYVGDWTPESVLLIEPGFTNPRVNVMGNPLEWVDVPAVFAGTRFATWNGTDSPIGGEVSGTMSFWSGECGGTHCPHSSTAMAALAVTLVPVGSAEEQAWLALASGFGAR